MVRPFRRSAPVLRILIAVWVLCGIASSWGRWEAVAAAAATPVEYRPASVGGLKVGGGLHLERRQAKRTAVAPAPTGLPDGWVSIPEASTPMVTPGPMSTAEPPTRSGQTTKTVSGSPAPSSAAFTSSTPPKDNADIEGLNSGDQITKTAVTSARPEGGIKSPIQHRPLALVLSMPFAVSGLGLALVVFILVLRGSAAVDSHSRRVIQAARMGRNYQVAK